MLGTTVCVVFCVVHESHVRVLFLLSSCYVVIEFKLNSLNLIFY